MSKVKMIPDQIKLRSCLIGSTISFDPFGRGKIAYEFRRREKEIPGLELGDGAVDILINADGDSSACSEEMQEFLAVLKGQPAEGGFDKKISDAVDRIKLHAQWRAGYMLYEIRMQESREEGREEGRKEGREEGREELMRELIGKFIHDGREDEEIMQLLSVTEEQIAAVREKLNSKE